MLNLFVWRVGILQSLLTALFLLPTLHVHPAFKHGDEKDQVHRHAIVHVDFLPFSSHDHGKSPNGDDADDSLLLYASRISFSTLVSCSLIFLSPLSRDTRFFIPAEKQIISSKTFAFKRALKQEHPPPLPQVFPDPSPPRAPPRFA